MSTQVCVTKENHQRRPVSRTADQSPDYSPSREGLAPKVTVLRARPVCGPISQTAGESEPYDSIAKPQPSLSTRLGLVLTIRGHRHAYPDAGTRLDAFVEGQLRLTAELDRRDEGGRRIA